jgi:hypothetical protein
MVDAGMRILHYACWEEFGGGQCRREWDPATAPTMNRFYGATGLTGAHISGTSLSAQARYAAGTREIIECWLEGRPIREEYIIAQGGEARRQPVHNPTPFRIKNCPWQKFVLGEVAMTYVPSETRYEGVGCCRCFGVISS